MTVLAVIGLIAISLLILRPRQGGYSEADLVRVIELEVESAEIRRNGTGK